MTFDNSELSIEYCLEKVRMCINEYMLPPDILPRLSDTMLGVAQDRELYNQLMSKWNALLLNIFFYIVSGDIQLPILEIKLKFHDLVMVTEG